MPTFLGMEIITQNESPFTSMIRMESENRFHMYEVGVPSALTREDLLVFRADYLDNHGQDPDRVIIPNHLYLDSPLSRDVHEAVVNEQIQQVRQAREERLRLSETANRPYTYFGGAHYHTPTPARDIEPPAGRATIGDPEMVWGESTNNVHHDTPEVVVGERELFEANISAGVQLADADGMTRIGVKVHVPEISLFYSMEVSEYSREIRIRHMRNMRLKLFKYLQRALRESFEREKAQYPHLWQNALSHEEEADA